MGADRYQARCRRVAERFGDEGIDAFIVSHLPNIRYLSGFTGSAAVLVLTPLDVWFFSDFRYALQAEAEVSGDIRVDIVRRDVLGHVVKTLAERDIGKRVGFEKHVVTVETARRFEEARPGSEFRGIEGLVEALRRVKDPDEIAAIKRAAGVAHDALAATLPTVRPGIRDIDVAAQLESALRVRGSEWHPFQTIVASGPRSALPHARTAERVIEPGDWLLIDFGAIIDGYCSDITRTFTVGRPPDDRQRTVYAMVREAQRAALEGIRVGMTGREADALARRVIEGRGFGDAFGHSLGHGLGLEVHEAPSLNRTTEELLQSGSVVTIEPGAYFPGWGGVRIEDDVLITDLGIDVLSDGRTELLTL